MLITLNWGVYIWAVNHNQVIEASMGYFLTPLLNVIAGVIYLKENCSARSGRHPVCCCGCCLPDCQQRTDTLGGTDRCGIFFGLWHHPKTMSIDAVPAFVYRNPTALLPFTLAVLLWLHGSGDALFLNLSRIPICG